MNTELVFRRLFIPSQI